MLVGEKNAVEAAKTLIQYCKEQRGCQNCIFRLYAGSVWKCKLDAFDLQDVVNNIAAKKKRHGYLV